MDPAIADLLRQKDLDIGALHAEIRTLTTQLESARRDKSIRYAIVRASASIPGFCYGWIIFLLSCTAIVAACVGIGAWAHYVWPHPGGG